MSKKILLNNSDVEYIKRLTSELTGSLADFIPEQKEQEFGQPLPACTGKKSPIFFWVRISYLGRGYDNFFKGSR